VWASWRIVTDFFNPRTIKLRPKTPQRLATLMVIVGWRERLITFPVEWNMNRKTISRSVLAALAGFALAALGLLGLSYFDVRASAGCNWLTPVSITPNST